MNGSRKCFKDVKKYLKTKIFSVKCDSSKDLSVCLYLYKNTYTNGRS